MSAIRSFGSNDTERLWRRERVPSIDPRIYSVALRKLRHVGSAGSLDDLRIPPGHRLEALEGDRIGQQSIGIDDQRRICFVWTSAGAAKVLAGPTIFRVPRLSPMSSP
ncbi:type II toxin-antitoxin system RelE/ParE family toxin [Demequina aurantiaca]|uniref:type II toxin-antitoxin system RelE/ParE family toxin n=1 Tax=Demequina aurantiaca TaxID=676200 RepID=UPI003D34F325